MFIPHCDTHLCDYPRAFTLPDTLGSLCTEILAQCPDRTVVFTDESVMYGSMVCAFILNRKVFKFPLNYFSLIFTFSLLAHCKALEVVCNLPPG
jgi:hypothetical protein